MNKQRLGGEFSATRAEYPGSVAMDVRLKGIQETLDECSTSTRFGVCYVRCDDCQESDKCRELAYKLDNRSLRKKLQAEDMAFFDEKFAQIQERINGNNGHNGGDGGSQV